MTQSLQNVIYHKIYLLIPVPFSHCTAYRPKPQNVNHKQIKSSWFSFFRDGSKSHKWHYYFVFLRIWPITNYTTNMAVSSFCLRDCQGKFRSFEASLESHIYPIRDDVMTQKSDGNPQGTRVGIHPQNGMFSCWANSRIAGDFNDAHVTSPFYPCWQILPRCSLVRTQLVE